MEVLVNSVFGAKVFDEKFIQFCMEKWNCTSDVANDVLYSIDSNSNPSVVNTVKEYGIDKLSKQYCDLRVIEIPKDATDYEVYEYDGLEHVIAVVDGKIRHIYAR